MGRLPLLGVTVPLPNTRMFHPRFEEHHRRVVAGQYTAECRIERPSSQPSVWDDATGRHTYPAPTVLYEGECRWQYQSAAGRPMVGQPVVADRAIPTADVRIVVPVAARVYQANDLVTLTASEHNPDIVGRTLTVQAVNGSSVSWQRDLNCQMRQPTTR